MASEVKQLVLGAKQDQQRGRQVNGKSAHAPDQQNEDKNLPYTQPDFNESDNNIQPEVTVNSSLNTVSRSRGSN